MRHRIRRSRARPLWGLAASVPALLLACGASPGDAVERGDRLYAVGRAEEAIAEYKLALRRHGEDPDVLLRLGSAYASRGDVDAGLEYFRRAVELDSAARWQVAAELSEAARMALERGGRENMARALEPVQAMGMGLIPEDLRLALAQYYSAQDDHGRALPLYLSLRAGPGSELSPAVLYETARGLRALGACREALTYYAKLVDGRGLDPATVIGARWQFGDCLYSVAEEDRLAGRSREAKGRLDRLIQLGVPQTLLDRAYYARGEISLEAGDAAAALSDFQAVLELNPARSGQLVARAQERILAIRVRGP